jgi:hypothetical protein
VVAQLLWAFGYQTGFTVPDMTPYGVQKLVGASHGVPLWFDEYRRDVRGDTVAALEGALRAAWGRQSGVKGGMKERWADLTELPASAPIVVTGEESLIEQSLTDRSVVVALPPYRGRGIVMTPGLIGPTFLWWLTACVRDECLPDRLAGFDRIGTAINTLEWGWDVFRRFALTEAFLDVGELDLSLVREDGLKPRIAQELEVLEWGLSKRDVDGLAVVWIDTDGKLVVRTQELLNLVRKQSDFALPGGSRWFGQVLRDRYRAKPARISQWRVLEMPMPPELADLPNVTDEVTK